MTDEPRAPGWYPDPWSTAEGDTRYFDGAAWVRNESVALTIGTPRRRRRSKWWLGAFLLAVGIGVVVAVTDPFAPGGTSSSSSSSASPLREISSTSSTTPHVQLEDRSYQRGDCVVWEQVIGEARIVRVVACNQIHLLEMVKPIELKDVKGSFPSDAAWQLLFAQQCSQPVANYLSALIDPAGRYAASGLNPGPDGWDSGDRTMWCAVASVGTAPPGPDTLVPFSGRARGNDQTRLEPVGGCLAADAVGVLSLVDCQTPHQVEVSGIADITGRVDHAPNADELSKITRADCDAGAMQYLGRPIGGDLATSNLQLDPRSWSAGRRQVECIVGHGSGAQWRAVSGSLRAGA